MKTSSPLRAAQTAAIAAVWAGVNGVCAWALCLLFARFLYKGFLDALDEYLFGTWAILITNALALIVLVLVGLLSCVTLALSTYLLSGKKAINLVSRTADGFIFAFLIVGILRIGTAELQLFFDWAKLAGEKGFVWIGAASGAWAWLAISWRSGRSPEDDNDAPDVAEPSFAFATLVSVLQGFAFSAIVLLLIPVARGIASVLATVTSMRGGRDAGDALQITFVFTGALAALMAALAATSVLEDKPDGRKPNSPMSYASKASISLSVLLFVSWTIDVFAELPIKEPSHSAFRVFLLPALVACLSSVQCVTAQVCRGAFKLFSAGLGAAGERQAQAWW